MRQCRKEHLHADQELLQAGRYVVHIVRRPVLPPRPAGVKDRPL